MKPGKKEVDAYLVSQPEAIRRALQTLRESIQAVAPDAEEAFVYGVPGFRLEGKPLACYAGFKSHCGFYPMSPAVISLYASELKEYKVSKGTIRFQPGNMLPVTLKEARQGAYDGDTKVRMICPSMLFGWFS